MNKLLNRSLKKLLVYAGLVLAGSIPVYYVAIRKLWQYELDEHNVTLSPEAGREDNFLIISAITLLTFLFFILLLGGLLIVNRRISRHLWQPFYKSLNAIRNFDLNQGKTIVFEQTDIAEFTELNQGLNKLISGSIAAYNQQKEFADNASHELQTPLAIVQSKLEVLLQSRSLTDEQYDVIEDALRALSRVSRINKNLLLLTKIENCQFMDKEMINLSELLNKTIPQFTHFSEDKLIELKTNIHTGVSLEGNKILVEILFHNLITNAIRYCPSQGTLSINLDQKRLVIANTGTAPLNAEQLFKRFATASAQSPGTGLGLALVKQICNRYDWNIEYAFENDRHIFSVHF